MDPHSYANCVRALPSQLRKWRNGLGFTTAAQRSANGARFFPVPPSLSQFPVRAPPAPTALRKLRKGLGAELRELRKGLALTATHIAELPCPQSYANIVRALPIPDPPSPSQFTPVPPSSPQSLPVPPSSSQSRQTRVPNAPVWENPNIYSPALPPNLGKGSGDLGSPQNLGSPPSHPRELGIPRKFGIPPKIQEFGVSSQGILVPPRTLGPPRSFGTPGFWEFCRPRAHPACPSSPSGTSKGFRGGGRSGAGFWGGPPRHLGGDQGPPDPPQVVLQRFQRSQCSQFGRQISQ